MKKIFCRILLGWFMLYTSFGSVYKKFDCNNYNFFGKQCTDCFGDGEMLILPPYIAKNAQELHIEAFRQSSVAIDSVDVFSRYANLSVLDIRTGRSFQVDEKFHDPRARENLRKRLFNLVNLKTLIIEYEEFNEVNNSWVLPPNLKELHLHHSVFEFDLYPCTVLETLIFTNNKLKKMPALRDPPPPLRVLSLSLENSLDDFSVDDIASLCKLQRLELVLYASEEDRQKRCECYRLEEWISNLKLEAEKNNYGYTFNSDVYLYCPRDPSPDCWNYTLDDAWKKREKCLWSHYGIVPKRLKSYAIVLVLIVIVVIMVALSYGIHCFKLGSRKSKTISKKSDV